jgi:hypothetical protein
MSQVVQVAGPRRAPRNRGPAFRGIAPGAGGTATVAFGTSTSSRRRPQKQKKKKGNGVNKAQNSIECWNAFSPQHLSLPRAVGEYTVTRGTRQISTDDKFIIVGTWQHSYDNATSTIGYGRNWCDVVALGCGDLSKKPSEAAWATYKMPMLAEGLGEHCQITPSACSVQVMNGNALQATSGMLYIGKLKVQPTYAGDDVDTGETIANNFVSYMAPRLCAAAKLALRGVHVDAHPLNMNRLADFTQVYRGFPGSTGTPGQAAWPASLSPAGFTPIVIYNPDGVQLNLLVCHEYRTRFELFNPACASHKYHAPSTDNNWADMIKKATELGSGALDIADVVAKSGLLQRTAKLFQ